MVLKRPAKLRLARQLVKHVLKYIPVSITHKTYSVQIQSSQYINHTSSTLSFGGRMINKRTASSPPSHPLLALAPLFRTRYSGRNSSDPTTHSTVLYTCHPNHSIGPSPGSRNCRQSLTWYRSSWLAM